MNTTTHIKHTETFLTTNELAALQRCAAQTVRKNFCTSGHYHGIRPLKQPSGRLLWKLSDVETLINGGAQ